MKILIVEDEPKTGGYLRQGLTEAGFVTDLVRDGWDGLHQATGGGTTWSSWTSCSLG